MRRIGIPILLLLLSSSVMAQLQPGIVVRSGAPFPIVADFNGDGLDDLIQERNVILNNGMLETEHDLGLPGEEKVIAVLDVNGDRVLDLITEETSMMLPPSLSHGWPGDRVYRLYLGDALHSYSKSIDISNGPSPFVADVDADGKDDIVLMTSVFDGPAPVATDVTVLRSRGDGTFDRLESFRIAPGPQIVPDYRVQTADLNHDGLPDLVVRCTEDLVVLLGKGGGHFAVVDHYLPANDDYGGTSMRPTSMETGTPT